jgi:hypothetical protein
MTLNQQLIVVHVQVLNVNQGYSCTAHSLPSVNAVKCVSSGCRLTFQSSSRASQHCEFTTQPQRTTLKMRAPTQAKSESVQTSPPTPTMQVSSDNSGASYRGDRNNGCGVDSGINTNSNLVLDAQPRPPTRPLFPDKNTFAHRGVWQYKPHFASKDPAIGSSCSICLDPFTVEPASSRPLEIKHCKHNFHVRCLAIWLIDNATCPMCRVKLYPRTQ